MRKIYSIPEFYDTVGHQWLEKKEGNRTARELAIINKEFPSPSFLIEAGCGYGRIAIPLANKHHQVYAFDSSFEMIQELCHRARLELTQKNNLMISKEDLEAPRDLPDEADGILFMWETFVNIEKEKQLSALKLYKKALKKNGKILIELPWIDVKAYRDMDKADIDIIENTKNYGEILSYWEGDMGVTFSIPNEQGMKELAAKTGMLIRKTYHYKVLAEKNSEERILYILAKKK